MKHNFDIAVVGGGIVGSATAYKLSKEFPDSSIVLIDKESELAAHQTGHNSGVIHSGIYYKPGSYKAKNCVDGRHQLVDFAREHNVAHDICGKIILAVNDDEVEGMNRIYERGLQNKIEGIRIIDSEEIKELEPMARGVKAIHVPCTGIIDFKGATRKLGELFSDQKGNKILFDSEVTSFKSEGESVIIKTKRDIIQAGHVIFCGGLQADRLAAMEGINLKMKVVPFRGDYYDLTEESKHKIKNLIYPVPNPEFPFLGVHLTRMTDGSVECGPNAVFAFDREGYSRTSFNFKDTADALTYKGTLKMFSKHWRNGIDEQRRAFSKKLFLKALRHLVPDLQMNDIKLGRCGVRAQALGEDGQLIDDFYFEEGKNTLHVLNAPSPAATACLSIADEIVNRYQKILK